jgi:hypothetical protein
MSVETYPQDKAHDEANVLRRVNEELIASTGIDSYGAAEQIMESGVARDVVDYQDKYDQAVEGRGAGSAESEAAAPETVEATESKHAEEIGSILASSNVALYTGIDGAGHKEFGQGSPDTEVKNYTDKLTYPALSAVMTKSPDLDSGTFNKIRNEADRGWPGSREKLLVIPSKNPDRLQLMYRAIGGHEWTDASGRGGQQVTVTVDGPVSEILRAVDIIRDDPIAVRELARQVVVERVGIDETTWENGSSRTGGIPLRPPYELWDRETQAPSLFVYSKVKTNLPTVGTLELK